MSDLIDDENLNHTAKNWSRNDRPGLRPEDRAARQKSAELHQNGGNYP